MSVLVLDAGNSIIKGKIARREQGEISFPHALRRLTESEYQKILSRARINGSAKDYIRVNGTPYVIGESAERHGLVTKRSGAARYTRDYYGILAGDFGFDAEAYNLVSNIVSAFCPLIAAVALVVCRHGWGQSWVFIRQAFDFRTKPIYFVLALAIPLGLNVLAHYLAPVFNLEVTDSLMGTIVPEGTSTPVVALMFVAYFFFILFLGGGQEEFGWRGYAQKPLQERYGILNASLLIGVVWGIWHAPLWIMPGDGHSTYSFLAFMLLTTGQAVMYGWLYNASAVTATLTTLIMETLSDRTRSKLGRRRPYILFGSTIWKYLPLIIS
jgi:membrane protease YdiL (CAAX protease family)